VDGALPQGPADAARTAQDTIGGAVHAASELSGATGDALLDVTRAAFTQGLQTAATICAVLAARRRPDHHDRPAKRRRPEQAGEAGAPGAPAPSADGHEPSPVHAGRDDVSVAERRE
jgi:DHA2 family multidrug resistance protein-like MFS transporter